MQCALKKGAVKQMIHKMEDTQCGFCPGRSTIDQIAILLKFSRNLGSTLKMSRFFLWNSEKRMPRQKFRGALQEWGIDDRLLLAIKPVCIPAQNFVPVPLSQNCYKVCSVTTLLCSLNDVDTQSQQVGEISLLASCKINNVFM